MKRFAILASLYVAQGLPFGFFTQALPVRMREEGVGLGAIGLTSLLAIPWALKFLWAPLVDRHGTRVRWILPLQLASTLTLVAISFVPPERSWSLVLAAVLLTNLFAATQDVATDGLAVDLLAPRERGLGNGIQVGGYRVGMILGGGVLLGALATLGWGWTLRALALLLALSTLPAIFTPTVERIVAPTRSSLRALLDAALRPGARGWLVVLLVYKSGDAIASAMLRPLLVDQGYGATALAVLLGHVGFGAGLTGALLGGLLVGRGARRPALIAFGLIQAASIASYALLAAWRMEGAALYALVAIEHVASGMATVALFTVMMDMCRKEHAATDYTLQASVVVIATGLGASASGFLAEGLGYPLTFLLASVVGLAGVALVALFLPPSPRSVVT